MFIIINEITYIYFFLLENLKFFVAVIFNDVINNYIDIFR